MIEMIIAGIFFCTILIGPFVGYFILMRNQRKERERKIYAYKNTDYYKCTHIPMCIMESDRGRFGEYNLYRYLFKHTEENARFLFNLYLPYKDSTTEIDVLMINSYGVFVFESKNFSGWIFGNEQSKTWCETFCSGRKEFFYNPIWQNKTHVAAIKNILGHKYPYHSAVVFGEHADLMDVEASSDVLSIYDIESYLRKEKSNDLISDDEINQLYIELYPYSQVSEDVKEEHIKNIVKTTGLTNRM